MDREDVRFRSVDAECAGWLYRPTDSDDGDVPCVVLAHGFGGVKEARLDAYAERFAAAGYAALVFDYRHHGDSAGEPRLLIDIGRQHDDWRAAIAHARGLDGVDANRIVAWGDVLLRGPRGRDGRRRPPLAAVIAQSPYMSGVAVLRSAGVAHNLRLTAAAMRDVVAGRRGGARPMAVVGPPGSVAAMASPDASPATWRCSRRATSGRTASCPAGR